MNKLKYLRYVKNEVLNHFLQWPSFWFNNGFAKPTNVTLVMSGGGCFFKCKMCDRWKEKWDVKAMSLEEKKRVLLLLRDWLGQFRLILGTQGDPFMEKDIFELIKIASDNDIITSVCSNGFLIDETMADKINSSGLNHLVISLDGIDEKTHDWVRGTPGSFKKVQRAIELLNKKREGMSLFINTIIMEQNLDQLVDMAKWVSGKRLDGLLFLQLESKNHFGTDPLSNDWFKDNELWPRDLKKVNEIFDNLILLKKDGYMINNSLGQLRMYKSYYANPSFLVERPCFIGVQNLNINADGNVYFCLNFDPVGNILEEKPESIWNSPEASERREEIKRCTAYCRATSCYYRGNILEKIEQFFKHRRLYSNYIRMRDRVE